MKKIFSFAIALALLSSCKKEVFKPKETVVTIQAQCDDCEFVLEYKKTVISKPFKGKLIMSIPFEIGSSVNVSMRLIGEQIVSVKLYNGDDVLLYYMESGENWPTKVPFTNNFIIK